MRVFKFFEFKGVVSFENVDKFLLSEGEIFIKVEVLGLCYMDVYFCDGDWEMVDV